VGLILEASSGLQTYCCNLAQGGRPVYATTIKNIGTVVGHVGGRNYVEVVSRSAFLYSISPKDILVAKAGGLSWGVGQPGCSL